MWYIIISILYGKAYKTTIFSALTSLIRRRHGDLKQEQEQQQEQLEHLDKRRIIFRYG